MKNILKDLVAFQSTADNPAEIQKCFDYLAEKLRFHPFVVKEYEHNGVKSVVWSTKDTLTPDILLVAHVDVVPAETKMFSLEEKEGKMLGRGVSDMKFSLAAFIFAAREILRENPSADFGIMVTSDEERGGNNGAGYLVREIGYKPKIAIVPDGGDNWRLVEEAKGVLHLKIVGKGKAAHASRPWEGENAIDKIAPGIVSLRNIYPQPDREQWQTTVNIGQIHGGKATNQVCNLAELYLDIRHLPGESVAEIKEKVQKCWPEAVIEESATGEPFKVDRNNPYVQKWVELLKTVNPNDILINEHGASDGRFFSAAGIPVIVSKPMGGGIHSENEWIDYNSAVQFSQILLRFMKEVLG